MNRRDFVSGLGAAVGAVGVGAHTASAGAEAAVAPKSGRKPNLIYVFADQLRYASCGYAGDDYARTPNMDRLAAESCNVHQAVASTPVCAPYRASLMTGKYQSSTGMVINEIRLSPEHRCFGQVLTEGGYHTGYIGKWHMWANQLGHHELVKNGFTPPGPYRLGFDGYWAAYNFNHYYFHSPYFLNNAEPHIRQDYEPDGQTDMAIRFVKDAARKDEPFALFLSWGPPTLSMEREQCRSAMGGAVSYRRSAAVAQLLQQERPVCRRLAEAAPKLRRQGARLDADVLCADGKHRFQPGPPDAGA